MKISICLLALFCNFITLKLHSNIRNWVMSHNQPSYMRSNLTLRFFLILSLTIGVIATCGLTKLSWYWNIPIYLVGLLLVTLVSDMVTEQNTKFHMFFILDNKPWAIYIWSLTIVSFILAVCGYNL